MFGFAILFWLLVNVYIVYKRNIDDFFKCLTEYKKKLYSPSRHHYCQLSNSHENYFIFFPKLQLHAQQNVPNSDFLRYFDTNNHLCYLYKINSANEHRTLHVCFLLFAFVSSSVAIAKSQCCHTFYICKKNLDTKLLLILVKYSKFPN